MSRQLLIWLLITGLVLSIITCITLVIQYNREHLIRIKQWAFGFAQTAAEFIDGDVIRRYEQTLEEDDYYAKIEKYLNASQMQAKISYIYVFVPHEDHLVYIWDSDTSEEKARLGQREDYLKGDMEAIFGAFQQEPEQKIAVTNDEIYGFLISAYSPVFDHTGTPVALVGVDLSVPRIFRTLLYYLLTIITCILVVVGIFTVAIYFMFNRQVVQPVSRIQHGMQLYRRTMDSDAATNELENIRIDNEIGALVGEFITLMVKIDVNTARVALLSAEKESIETELNVATRIQMSLLPQTFPAFPERKEFDLYASMHPAREVGGDFYDFFLIDDDHLALVMADVSGKGVPAALFMVKARTLIKYSARMGSTPGEIFTDVNVRLCEGNDNGMFVTAWMAILELSTGKGLAVNAGHEHPVIRRSGGSYELVQYKHSPVLAFMNGIRYREHAFQLNPGDRLFVYTDGVPEATNADSKLYGCQRMIEDLNATGDASCEEALQALKRSVDSFVGSAPQFDDITMLCLDYYGSGQ